MIRGLGCNRPVVPPHWVRPSFRLHPAATRSPPPSYDQRSAGVVAAIKDQGQTSSCEGHSSSWATETFFSLAGAPLGFVPSERHLYAGGRMIERSAATPAGATLPALVDEGTTTEAVVSFMGTLGVRARSAPTTSDGRNSDCEPDTIDDELLFGDLEASDELVIAGPYAIDPTASDAEGLVRMAIAANIPVRVDAFVDSTFEQWAPGQPPIPAPNMGDSSGGGHAVVLCAYDAASGFYLGPNSWGKGWGEAGYFRVSPAWLRVAWGISPWTCKRAGIGGMR